MALYRQVSEQIAGQIESGQLTPGTQLLSLRDAARAYGTTTATASRAYRALADAGVIHLHDRARATVALSGQGAARRLLNGNRTLRLAGSDDPALDLALRATDATVLTIGERGSFQGLTRLWRGSADVAAIHLPHRSGVANKPFAMSVLRDRQPVLIHLWRREQGWLTPPGNPDRLSGPADLRRLRVARRPFGTGTRVLFDRLLAQSGVKPQQVSGPEVASHLEVAMTIAAGQADAGLGARAAAMAMDLDFLPVAWEEFDLVLGGATLSAAEPLIAALRDPATLSAVDSLGGYDATRTGTVERLA
ncbi:MAG: GntR family transcriptional regulator [Acidimicrobiaceae bacterium]|nr:GntR family transcriptional regulator [Acidimicrobiaceae bacterium]